MFNLVKIEGGRINVHEPEIHVVGAVAIARGTVCTLDNGKLVAATGITKPTHIALASAEGGKDAKIPTGRIEENQVYETIVSVDPSTLTVGAKVQLDDGVCVNNDTDSGVATIVDKLDATVPGDIIHVRF